MNRVFRCGSLIGIVMFGLACDTEPPNAPNRRLPPPTTEPAPPIPEPPPLVPGELVATYVFNGRLDYNISGFTAGSQYLLYENGVFGLRYDAFSHVYLGWYQQAGETITFRFDQQGNATGTLKGDLLEVRYDIIMQHSDFENAVYRRAE